MVWKSHEIKLKKVLTKRKQGGIINKLLATNKQQQTLKAVIAMLIRNCKMDFEK
jgi:hypothetical protein